jgi:predicted RecA/RadA family phage recombinase
MNNFSQPGEVLTFTAPTGGVVSGLPYLIGSLLVIAAEDVAQTLPFEGEVVGVYNGTKVAIEAWDELQKVYWDDTAHKFTETQGSSPANVLVGVAAKAVAAAITLATSATGSPAGLTITDATLTVGDYSTLADITITITVARASGDPLVYILTEGIDFDAETDNATTATNIAAAITALSGVTGTYTQIPGSPATETVVVTSDNPNPGVVRLDGAVR